MSLNITFSQVLKGWYSVNFRTLPFQFYGGDEIFCLFSTTLCTKTKLRYRAIRLIRVYIQRENTKCLVPMSEVHCKNNSFLIS